MKVITYLRVSTAKQGKSGLGLEAQREAIRRYLGSEGWPPVAEFVEQETGKGSDAIERRPKLKAALAACKVHKAILVVAKIDRLSRNMRFIAELVDSADVDFRAADHPTAARLTIHVIAAVAEDEARRISERTKAALAAAKAKGKVLGGFRGVKVDPSLGTAALRAKAKANAQIYASTIAEIKEAGATSLRAIANELNARGITTPGGKVWYAMSVRNALAQLQAA